MADCIPIPKGGNFQDLTGKTFGRLTIVGYQGKSRWKCICECGATKELVNGSGLRRGHTRSCRCLKSQENTIHGLSESSEYLSWASMKQRCSNRKNIGFHLYGGRGIKVCERWNDSFCDFYADMGAKPSATHSIDRFPDKNGNYEPGNCRWATPSEQVRNRRTTIVFSVDGLTMPLAEWSEFTGISRDGIALRIKRGWSADEAICLPLQIKVNGHSRRRYCMV
jgi:hypothetical protein